MKLLIFLFMLIGCTKNITVHTINNGDIEYDVLLNKTFLGEDDDLSIQILIKNNKNEDIYILEKFRTAFNEDRLVIDLGGDLYSSSGDVETPLIKIESKKNRKVNYTFTAKDIATKIKKKNFILTVSIGYTDKEKMSKYQHLSDIKTNYDDQDIIASAIVLDGSLVRFKSVDTDITMFK